MKLVLDKYALSYLLDECRQWTAEAGEFVIIAARSADPEHELLRASFTLAERFFWWGV